MNELTESEQKNLRIVLVHIFGSEATGWPMNKNTLRATGEMLEGSRRCSDAMDYVPRPAGYTSGVSYLRKQLEDLARRARRHDQVYEACKRGAKIRWKSTIYNAANGLYY